MKKFWTKIEKLASPFCVLDNMFLKCLVAIYFKKKFVDNEENFIIFSTNTSSTGYIQVPTGSRGKEEESNGQAT